MKFVFSFLLLLLGCSWNDVPSPFNSINCLNGIDCYSEDIPEHARGYFYDKQSRILILNGLSSPGSAKSKPDFLPWQQYKDYKQMKDWGFNHLKLMYFWNAIEPQEGKYDTAYINGYIQHIAWCEKAGIYVILKFHKDVYGPFFKVESKAGIPEWATDTDSIAFRYDDADVEEWGLYFMEPAVQKAFKNFWTKPEIYQAKYIRALKYFIGKIEERGFTNVLGIDPMNEPFPHQLSVLDGNIMNKACRLLENVGSVDDFEKYYLAPFYENVKRMLEDNYPKYRLFLEPWISTSAGYPSNITKYYEARPEDVYTPHLYPLFQLMGENYEGDFDKRTVETILGRKVNEAKSKGIPFMLGEFGADGRNKSHLKYINHVLNFLDENGAGRTYYSYDVRGAGEYSPLNQDTTANEMMDILVRAYVPKIAGRRPKFKVSDNSFSVEYTNIGINAPTEIYIPPRLKGVTITINGKDYPNSTLSNNIIQYRNTESKKQKITIRWD